MFLNTISDSSLTYFIFYLFFYNLTIMSLILIILVLFGDKFSYNFKFNEVNSNIFFKLWLVLIFLSLAGLPPFIGFTAKILILNMFIKSQSFLMFFFFFSILLVFLFFYTQNLKIVFTNSKENLFSSYKNIKSSNFYFFNWINFFSFLLIFNLFFIDDVILFISYLL